jgi:murein DD-endopeptidase MepM/ murein hydrolase activator NlpD
MSRVAFILAWAVILSGCATGRRGRGYTLEAELRKTLSIQYELNDEDPEWAESAEGLPFRWPLRKATLTSGFGWRSGRPHHGVDLAVPEGTSVVAALGGVVVYAGSLVDGYGETLMIRHIRGYSTVYAHCSQLLVPVGERVIAGQRIALSGETGRASAPHLHFEVRKELTPLNPLQFLPPSEGIRGVPRPD